MQAVCLQYGCCQTSHRSACRPPEEEHQEGARRAAALRHPQRQSDRRFRRRPAHIRQRTWPRPGAIRDCLPLIEAAATDDRNFVKKGVNWALRGVGERSLGLHKAAMTVARRLAKSEQPAPRWVGRDAERQLQKPTVL
ncbi:MAG TPA: hypothetical protein EYP98_00860 [Planctomycetes bacterium]|nr:hypothetical protein [Planctomycetota bacterium]